MERKNRLQELLDILDITAAEMSRATGIPKSSISMWLSGERTMRQDKIGIISDFYHINPAWLMGYPVPMHRSVEEAVDTFRLLSGERNEMLSRTEGQIIDAYREADDLTKAMVLRTLGLDKDIVTESRTG